MMKKWFAGLFLGLLCASFSAAQKTNQSETQWEILEVSYPKSRSYSGFSRKYRIYTYLTSDIALEAPDSLVWMKDSGWELVGITFHEGSPNYLYFKRRYSKQRTEKEIEWLKKEYEETIPKPPVTGLINLDEAEAQQKLNDFNNAEELKLRTALEQIKDLPIKVISVSANSGFVDRTRVGAEIVLDGTSVLLKDGNKYRAAEVDKYFKDSAKQILNSIGASLSSYSINSNAQVIARGGFYPQIGDFSNQGDYVGLKISIVVNYNNQQTIVAQNTIYGKWTAAPK